MVQYRNRPLGLLMIAILSGVFGVQGTAAAESLSSWDQAAPSSLQVMPAVVGRTKQQLKQTSASPSQDQIQQVSTEMLTQISVLKDFVLQNPTIFEIRDASVFDDRDPEVIATLAPSIRAIDDLQLLARAFRSPEHIAEGVTLLTALNDSLAAFPRFVRSSQFVTAYRQLNASDKSTVAVAVKELADVLRVMRGIAVTEIGGDFGPAESESAAARIEADFRRIRDEEDMNWRN